MEKGKTYRAYSHITREQANGRGFDGKYLVTGYDARKARELLERYPMATAVEFARPEHNESRTRYNPPEGVILYVKSRGGKHGKAVRVRLGDGVCEPLLAGC